MKLSELYTVLKLEGFGQYIAEIEKAKAANKTYEVEAVKGMARAGEATRASAEALRRVTAGGMGRDIASLEHPGAITSRAFVSRIHAATEALKQFQIVEQSGAVSRMGAGSGVTHAADRLRAMRDRQMVEGVMGGAFPDVQLNKIGSAADNANVKLLRFNQTGRMVAMLFGSDMPAGAGRTISSLSLVMSAMDSMTNRARIMHLAMRGAMVVGAGAVGYGVGRMIGDPLARLINPEQEQKSDEGNRRAVANTHRQNAIIQNIWDTRNSLLQIQMKGLDPLSKESEYLQEQLITRNYLVERGKMAAEAGAVGVENAGRIYDAEMRAMRESMARGRAEAYISDAKERQNRAAREEADFAEKVAHARKNAADQAERERNAARDIRESAFAGAAGLFPGRRGEMMMERALAARLLRASGPEQDAMIEEFQLGRLTRERAGAQSDLSSILGQRPRKIAGGVSDLEGFARAIQSAAATVEPGKAEWERRVATALESIDKTDGLIKDFLEKLLPGVQLVDGEF